VSEPVIDRYFARAADPDLDAYFAQFAADAVVEDEGNLYEGIDAIRGWRTTVPPVSYHLRRVEPTERGRRAVAEIRGDFPGSPVTLGFAFVVEGDTIRELTIRPADE
jgi:alpha-D-ribose 1-methylphosphonate 5-triphosphate synthase subunit PhnI